MSPSNGPVFYDTVDTLVDNLISGYVSGNDDSTQEALASVSNIPTSLLLGELVERANRGIDENGDIDAFLFAASSPLPRNPKSLLSAVGETDYTALDRYADGDLATLVAALVTVIAALEATG